MEAKKKAKQLIDKMHGFTLYERIRNAIVTVDEIISELKMRNGSVVYWLEVKKELIIKHDA